MATPRDHSAGLAGLVPASHLLLASLPGYLSAGLAPARGRPRVSETWSDQPPACFASFARVLTSLLRISCSRPHNVGPAHPDPPVLPALPRAREQRRPQMTSSASARTSPPAGPGAGQPPCHQAHFLPVMVIIFPNFVPPGGPSYAGSLGWRTHRPARYPPAASNDSTHSQEPRTRQIDLFVLFDFRRRFLACS